MAERMINCIKLGKQAIGLKEAPFAGELGEEIFNKISAEAWKQWQDDMMIKIINEYRLDLTDEAQYQVLIDQMKAFLSLTSNTKVLEVENAERGKSKDENPDGGCCGGGCGCH